MHRLRAQLRQSRARAPKQSAPPGPGENSRRPREGPWRRLVRPRRVKGRTTFRAARRMSSHALRLQRFRSRFGLPPGRMWLELQRHRRSDHCRRLESDPGSAPGDRPRWVEHQEPGTRNAHPSQELLPAPPRQSSIQTTLQLSPERRRSERQVHPTGRSLPSVASLPMPRPRQVHLRRRRGPWKLRQSPCAFPPLGC